VCDLQKFSDEETLQNAASWSTTYRDPNLHPEDWLYTGLLLLWGKVKAEVREALRQILVKEFLDLALTLFPVNLPPYVLLEVVDWLPGAAFFTRKEKIDLLVKATASCEQVVESRPYC
jgi:hypothetical protein